MINRRSILRLLGSAPIAVPAVALAAIRVKDISKPEVWVCMAPIRVAIVSRHKYDLEQQWQNNETGETEWRPIEKVYA